MSRWRETLCGSAIQGAETQGREKEIIQGDDSQVLSCGGQYLSHQTTFSKPFMPTILFLPNDKQETVVVEAPLSNCRRYSNDSAPAIDDLELAEDEETSTEFKGH
ncbi:MAG: hypothetical protein A3G32_00770 [Deltaproteobacteria bacterium RIFCSPLOWO2_12_FULL_40_28]|nr:MAG: hypothetical protein A3C45_09655 [Deltaproteobacteria bacterium RIFCSPHIGHO2_02_FULL_40_28]OGQ19873.1 MAG: hypothetical protein A3E27_06605 [Deltaproteobacteria bacterium RIFCSPHIGHO2_12_FULL_40_32]OGQ39632.1 MAG: hypothetical protein A3I69_06035 [Deltaproteobacteria bacterium RIFCSPLOWO2_02_FULL_40_36]OGQ52888.1 MAG: hypothetical protein A3G32_00770 [Deltaproteobacteria bacterium RIFCSPLOWO2_12_FULL_40_28]